MASTATASVENTQAEWPKKRFANWDWLSFFDRANSEQQTYRSADVFFAACAACQAYLPTTKTLPIIKKLIPGVTFERLVNVGPDNKSWDIYERDEYILISIPGTQTLRELLRESGATLAHYPGLPINWWLWKGFFDIAVPYAVEFLQSLSDRLAKPDRFIIFTGHSLGAILAAWFSFYLNYICPFEGRGAKPVIACYSFASPAGWVDTTGLESFTRFHRHYRVIVPGDPVVDAIQTGSVGHPADPPEGQRKYSIAQHYANYLGVVGPSTNFLALGDQLGKAFWQLFTANSLELKDMIKRHFMNTYLAGIQLQCEGKEDTPIPAYGTIKQWAALLQGTELDIFQ